MSLATGLPSRLLRLATMLGVLLAQFGILLDQSRGDRPRAIDESRANSVGIRKIVSKHLVLFTDVPASAEVDRLAAVFDLAVPEWAAYLGAWGNGV